MRVALGGKLLAIAAVATALTMGVIGSGVAQDATPAATDEAAGGFPNHFHLGTCDELDPAPAVQLADLRFPDWATAMSAAEGGEMEEVLADAADFGNAPIPVAVATTEVAVPLADIVAGGHALNVHDAEDVSVYIACGNVGGIADERGDLFIGLDEVDGSGYSGVAWLHDNGASTTVVVFLSNPEAQAAIDTSLAAMAAAAAEEATPETAPAATPETEADATPIA